jgi:pimeloyl-ACP methyl ester carboxylesterase
VLLLHGGQDRIIPSNHASWLAAHCRAAELRLSPPDNHIFVLSHAESGLEWILDQID